MQDFEKRTVYAYRLVVDRFVLAVFVDIRLVDLAVFVREELGIRFDRIREFAPSASVSAGHKYDGFHRSAKSLDSLVRVQKAFWA